MTLAILLGAFIVAATALGIIIFYTIEIRNRESRISELTTIITALKEYISDLEYINSHKCCCDSEMLDIDSPKE